MVPNYFRPEKKVVRYTLEILLEDVLSTIEAIEKMNEKFLEVHFTTTHTMKKVAEKFRKFKRNSEA